MDPVRPKDHQPPSKGRLQDPQSAAADPSQVANAATRDAASVVAAFMEAHAVPSAREIIAWCDRFPLAAEAIVHAATEALARDIDRFDPGHHRADERDVATALSALDRAARNAAAGRRR